MADEFLRIVALRKILEELLLGFRVFSSIEDELTIRRKSIGLEFERCAFSVCEEGKSFLLVCFGCRRYILKEKEEFPHVSHAVEHDCDGAGSIGFVQEYHDVGREWSSFRKDSIFSEEAGAGEGDTASFQWPRHLGCYIAI